MLHETEQMTQRHERAKLPFFGGLNVKNTPKYIRLQLSP
jgi:hypothetical protein